MKYYLYQITNLVNNKIYVGVHMTKDMSDGYMGSGKVIRKALKKHGPNNFRKDILETFDNSKAMYDREKEFVTDEFVSRKDVYNLRRGGVGGFTTSARKKAREITNSRYPDKLSIWGRKGGQTNFRLNGVNQNYRIAGMTSFLVKKHTKKTKEKIGVANSKHQKGSGNSQFGTMWITNDIESKKINKALVIPEGWRQGRKIAGVV